MAMVFAVAGLTKWINDGNTLDKAVMDSWEDDPPTFTGAVGHFIHSVNGSLVIPVLGLALLIVSFFAAVDGAVKWAAIVVVSIVVQVMLGFGSADAPVLGLVHGLNAFILFGAALMAARTAREAKRDTVEVTSPAA
jgi:heme A synthase